MAENKTPQLLEIAGVRVFRVSYSDACLAVLTENITSVCNSCPLNSRELCTGSCGVKHVFVQEDVWLKSKLRKG